MPIHLTKEERNIAAKLADIKKKSGSHSPSPAMLAKAGVTTLHDFCYLSNPHATELFLKYFRRDFKNDSALHALVEHYPSQNRALAEKVSTFLTKHPLGVSPFSHHPVTEDGATPPQAGGDGERWLKAGNIFVGNGATEIIQAVLQNFTEKKILVPIPTFSPYLEFAPEGVMVVMHQLVKENDFRLDIDAFLARVKKEKPDTVIIINPNNPDGGYLNATKLRDLLEELRHVETVVVDESFTHFAGRSGVHSGCGHLMSTDFPNLVVIKSLSKDFGVAGLRLGYAVMSEKRVSALLERGYLWNVSGFGEYFLSLLGRTDFLKEYEKARLRAIGERDAFYSELSKIKELRVYPSRGNFFLVELLDGTTANDLMVRLLVGYGIYIRPCGDKVGLKGEYVRIASRTAGENNRLIQTLKEALSF